MEINEKEGLKRLEEIVQLKERTPEICREFGQIYFKIIDSDNSAIKEQAEFYLDKFYKKVEEPKEEDKEKEVN